MTARFAPTAAGVHIDAIDGDGGRLPREAARNTAGVAAQALLTALGERRGVLADASQGAAAVERPRRQRRERRGGGRRGRRAARRRMRRSSTLIACALEGERLGAGSAHADNIAPSLCGGFVLVRHPNPPDIVRLPVPAGLTAVVVHPDLEIETAKARALLGDTVPLADAVRQWANLGALVDGLHRGDFALIARSLEDTIAEPRRAPLVPGPGRASSRRPSTPARSAAACRDRGRRSSRCAAAMDVAGASPTR